PYTQVAKLTASDGATGDYFGSAVAISADGSTILVGAPQTDNPSSTAGNGFAYVFTLPSGGWANASQTAKLRPSTYSSSSTGDLFGWSVSLSADGSTALIGAPGYSDYGAVYVYNRPGGGWVNANQSATITASDVISTGYGEFGQSVSLSADGSIALIGAKRADNQGAAYIYNRPGSTWTNTSTYTAKLTASVRAAGDLLGYSVSLSSNGTTAIVGAVGKNSFQGAAYLFNRLGGGWATATESAILTASDGVASDIFGIAVTISGDGQTVLIGAQNVNSSRGAAYIYTKPVSGGWATTSAYNAKFTISSINENNHFGCSVSLNADGSKALIGSYGYDYSPSPPGTNNYKGAVDRFTRPTGGWASTTAFDQRLMASDAVASYRLGNSVSLSADGLTAVAGSPGNSANPTTSVGRTYVFSAGPANETACTTVNTTLDVVNATDNLISLREAITYAGTLGGTNQTITF
ncbi:MAG: hypothetical protein ACKO5E_09755, partial [bacterium]